MLFKCLILNKLKTSCVKFTVFDLTVYTSWFNFHNEKTVEDDHQNVKKKRLSEGEISKEFKYLIPLFKSPKKIWLIIEAFYY